MVGKTNQRIGAEYVYRKLCTQVAETEATIKMLNNMILGNYLNFTSWYLENSQVFFMDSKGDLEDNPVDCLLTSSWNVCIYICMYIYI